MLDDRGLTGLGDLQGLPWFLHMDKFFEAWLETVVGQLARRTGGLVKNRPPAANHYPARVVSSLPQLPALPAAGHYPGARAGDEHLRRQVQKRLSCAVLQVQFFSLLNL